MRRFLSLFVVLMLSGVLAFSQSRVVTGKVTDASGNSVSNASIKVKGAKSGVSANANGVFKITVPEGSTLVISAVGFEQKEVAAEDNVTVALGADVKNLSEVVIVTAAGIKRTEKSIGYAVSKVDPNTLLQKSEPDVLKALQGQVAGVDIRSSQGTPGAATRIQIRGNSSFFGDNQPLIVVDGVPYSNDMLASQSQTTGGGAYSSGIANLDPNDIASMNVLKGSSASALYGSRASNGVIIITTKSGSAARTKKGLEVNVKSSVSFENIANLPDYQNLFGTGSQGNLGGGSNGSWGKKFAIGDSQEVWSDYANAFPELFPNKNAAGKRLVAYQAHPDNVSNLFQTGVVYENSVGFNGGDEKTAFSLTGSQLNQGSYVPNSDFNRTSLSGGGSTKLNIGLNLRGNFSYTRTGQKGGLFGENQGGATSQFARSLFLGRSWDTNLPFEDKFGNDVSFLNGQFDNPKWAYKYNTSRTNEERTIAGMHADFNITKWARVDYNIGSNVNTLSRQEIVEVSSRGVGLGSLIEDNYRHQEIESTLLLTFNPKITNDFTVTTRVGTNFNQRTSKRLTIEGDIFVARGIHTLKNTSTQTQLNSNLDEGDDEFARRRLLGVFGDVTIGFKNFAFITATGRNDWSSTLPVNNRSYFYPSISGSLVFSDALKINNNILDYGKIRGGWAKVGRDADPYSTIDLFSVRTNFLGQTRGTTLSTHFDNNLKPEFTREVEVGTQLSFLKKRIEVDFTWYDKKSTSLIAPISTGASTGYTQFYTNYGAISNKGIEVELTVRPVRTKSFTWEVKGIFTKNKNIVEELTAGVPRINLGGGFNTYSAYLETGKPFGYIRGTKSIRDSVTGELLIDPTTGFLVTAGDQGEIGDPNPEFKMGITNTFTYKGFFLSGLFDYTKGGDIYSVTISSELGRGVTQANQDRETGWVIPGIYIDNKATLNGVPNPNYLKALKVGGKTVPNQTRITTNDLYFGSTFAINTAAEWNVYDGTVYRLRELTFGYELPKSLFKKLPIGSVTFSVTGRNLWYLAPGFPKHTNFDPEVSSYGSSSIQGLEFSAAPTSKRIGLNLNVTF